VYDMMSGKMPRAHQAVRRLASQSTPTETRPKQFYNPFSSVIPPTAPSCRRQPLSSQCLQLRQFSSSSAKLKAGDKMYHRTGVRMLTRGMLTIPLTCEVAILIQISGFIHRCRRRHGFLLSIRES
jgi:hypothetical protein